MELVRKMLYSTLSTILLGFQRLFGTELTRLEEANRKHIKAWSATLRRIRHKARFALIQLKDYQARVQRNYLGKEQSHE